MALHVVHEIINSYFLSLAKNRTYVQTKGKLKGLGEWTIFFSEEQLWKEAKLKGP